MHKKLHLKVFALALLVLLAVTHAALAGSPYAPAQPLGVIPACVPINSNTTWTTGNIYVVQDCNLTIANGATLTIQPGVIVKFWGTAPGYASALGSVAVIVEGSINAIGTAAQPIIFTSYADDATVATPTVTAPATARPAIGMASNSSPAAAASWSISS